MTQPFRIEPELPIGVFQSYELRRPAGKEFWRKATCEEANCPNWQYGWETRIDLSSELGQQQAAYIVKRSGRHFSQEREGDMVVFVFTPGQECFSEHQIAVEREPIYLKRDGDWRGNPTGNVRRHTRGQDWVEDMQEQLGRVIDDRKRG
jgi:hypothetical protein